MVNTGAMAKNITMVTMVTMVTMIFTVCLVNSSHPGAMAKNITMVTMILTGMSVVLCYLSYQTYNLTIRADQRRLQRAVETKVGGIVGTLPRQCVTRTTILPVTNSPNFCLNLCPLRAR